jgi:ribonuclease J
VAADVRITFLGGLGDIGRNCAVLETDDRLVLLDCGQLFPDEMSPGADSIYPDFSYLDGRWHQVEAAIVTHAHEDHIGALAHALGEASFPVYGSAFTLGLVRHRLDEGGVLSNAELRLVNDGETLEVGPFSVEFLPVTHSVPSGLISAITTPQGVVLHSSDFKLDPTPLDGRLTDLPRIAEIAADPGIRLLLCDSTNANSPGATRSETEIGPVLDKVFADNAGRRIITACFASHIHRVIQIVDAALAHDRKVATLGLSMKRNVALARQLGMLKIPEDSIVDIEEVAGYADGDVCIVSTGSQAENRSALAMAAGGDSRWIDITANDTVVLSSTPIPGNEAAIARMINNLIERGATVLHSGVLGLHTSGHGNRDELATLHKAARPEWFVPVHGEHQHLVAHIELAQSLGMAGERALLARDGDQVVLADDGLSIEADVVDGVYLYRHGAVVSPNDDPLRDRRILGQEGFVGVVVTVDVDVGEMVGEPLLVARGWMPPDTELELEPELIDDVARAVIGALDDGVRGLDELHRRVRRATGQFVSRTTRRRPMIVPVVVSI